MRLLIDSLIALMLVAILAGVLVHHRGEQARLAQHRDVHEGLSELYEQTLYHAALEHPNAPVKRDPHTLNRPLQRFPDQVLPAWFEEGVPLNPLAPHPHPWMDVAPAEDRHDHPPDPVLRRPEQAGYWYNPARGVFRARVPQQDTEAATLALYNQLNNAALKAFPDEEAAADRQPSIPIAMLPPVSPVSPAVGRSDPAAAEEPATPATLRRPKLLQSASGDAD